MRANLATALGVGPKQDLPPIMFQTEVADVGDQMGELAGREGLGWGWHPLVGRACARACCCYKC